MNKIKFLISQKIISLSFFLILVGCNNSSIKNTLNLESSKPPIELPEVNANFYKEIKYGKSSNNSFDLFIPDAIDKTPLVIFVHGGGFERGDKSHAYKGEYPKQIGTFLKNNIAFATINYRFLSDPESKGVITSLNDSRKCLQFIRYHADEINIDKEKICMYGSSAGSGTSLWLGFNDDMKDTLNDNPIRRESTRIQAVGALETQATYDLIQWDKLVFKPFNFSFEKILKPAMRKTFLSFYGIDNFNELYSEKMKTYRENIDFLKLMSKDDPPIWVKNTKYEAGFPKSKKAINHHPFHAKVLRERAEKTGLDGVFYIPKLEINDSTGLNLVDFMIEKLK